MKRSSKHQTTSKKHRARACERLERRTLLSTYVINGTNSADTWTLEADAGQITLNGTPISSPGLTDVQVNGLDGNDTLFVAHTSVPVVFNGGNGNDQLFLGVTGQMSAQITGKVTLNGGAGTDSVDFRDENWSTAASYQFSASSFAFGAVTSSWDSAVETLTLYTGPGGADTAVKDLTFPINITVNGGIGSDNMLVGMNGSTGTVGFAGGNGAGIDTLDVLDTTVIGPVTYTITGAVVSRSGRTINHAGFEGIELDGVLGSAGTYNVSGGSANTSLALIGGNASDAFSLTAAQFGAVTIAGGSGALDSLVVDDRTQSTNVFRANLGTTSLKRDYGPDGNNFQTYGLDYSSIEAWTYYGKNSTTAINVYGTPSSIPAGQQATIICGANADTVTLYPHDASGNLTINGNLGVIGGGGSDKVVVDDSASSIGIHYVFTNTYNAGTQNINGLGTRGFGAASDVETIEVHAGDGEDTFVLDTWETGAALNVAGGDGYDTFDVSPTAHSLTAAIPTTASMSSFFYNGQGGQDHFNIHNYDSTLSWQVSRTNGSIAYGSNSTSYSRNFGVASVGYLFASGGTLADQYFIYSTPADDMNNDFYGAGGNDTYAFGNGSLTSGIFSYCNVNGFGGNDSIIIDDSADTVGRSFHINSGFINAVPSDTLFPSAGGDIYGIVVPNNVTGTITIKLGSGADTVNFAPVPVGQGTYVIQANNPTSAPGDRLNLAFAAATNPVFVAQGTGNGTYTFSNRATMSYTGIETKTIDSVAPTFLGGKYNYDPASGSSVDFRYSENVFPGLYNTYFDLYNWTTGQSIRYGMWAYTYDTATNTVHYTFPGLPGGVLPAGSYRASSSRVTDAAGNTLVGQVVYNFIWTGGTSGADTFRVAVNSDSTITQVYQNNDGTPAFTADFSSLALISIASGEGDDSVIVDCTNGNPLPMSGIVLDGGNGTDSLTVLVTDLVDTISFNDGAVIIDGGQVTHSNFEHVSYSGGSHYVALAVNAGSVTLSGIARFDSLFINDGAAVTIANGSNGLLIVHSLNLAPGGLLDLADGDLLVQPPAATRRGESRGGDPLATIQALINSARHGGLWDGFGITSSAARDGNPRITTLGAMRGSDYLTIRPAFDGQSVAATDVLVKYTYYGDADFNGKVNFDDYSHIDAGFNGHRTGWINGDFSGNGVINFDDYSLIDQAFNGQSSVL